jgi:periplasmic protein TonB
MFESTGTSNLFRWSAALCLVMGMLTGCSKEEPKKPRDTPQLPVTATPQASDSQLAPRKSVDYMAGLKNSKDESKAVTREELERSAKQVVQSAEASKAAMAEAVRPAEPRPAPAAAVAQTPTPAAPAPAPAPVQAPRPTAPADDVIAKAAPTAAAAPSNTVTPITRSAPDFPRDAIRAGVESGTVRARLTIDASGNVTNVQIVEARPTRVFDRAVRDSLGKWKFNNGTDGRTYDTEVDFKR